MSINLTIDTTGLPPGTDPMEATRGVGVVAKRRIEAFRDAARACVYQAGQTLRVLSQGVSKAEAAELVTKVGLFQFKEPKIDEDTLKITCSTPTGAEFVVSVQQISEVTNDAGRKESRCGGDGGESGTVVWIPATATDKNGSVRALTGSFLKANGADITTGTTRGYCIPACVILSFNGDGGLLFDQITTRLVGKPLAIFLDEVLIGAPMVNQRISNGQAVITGLSLDEAKTLKVQLNTGALPAPVTVTSIEDTP